MGLKYQIRDFVGRANWGPNSYFGKNQPRSLTRENLFLSKGGEWACSIIIGDFVERANWGLREKGLV